jgi:hypothetical protein
MKMPEKIFTKDKSLFDGASYWLAGVSAGKNKFSKNLPLIFFGVFLALIFFVHGASAATYYVDNSIVDTNIANATPDFTTYNHTTFETTGGSDSVFKTIADINAFAALQPDDQVLFRKGETWREQLTVPASGTDGHPITFGAYGDGDGPKILASSQLSSFSPFKPDVDFYGSWEMGGLGGISEGQPAVGDVMSSGGSGVSGPNMGWTASAGTIAGSSDVAPVIGNYSLKLDHNTSIQKNFPAASDEIYSQFNFRYTNTPSDYLLKLMATSNADIANVTLSLDSKVKIYNYTTAAIVSSGAKAISLNKWYRLKVHYKVSETAGVSEWWLEEWNGSQWVDFDSSSALDLNTGLNNVGKIRFMSRQGSAGNYMYLDEIYINRGANDITPSSRESSSNIVVGYNPNNVVPTYGFVDYKMRRLSWTWSDLGNSITDNYQFFVPSIPSAPRQIYVYLPSLPVGSQIVEVNQPGVVTSAVYLNSNSYVTIEGLEIGQSADSGVKIQDGEGNVVQDCYVRDSFKNIYNSSSNSFVFRNNLIFGSASYNIFVDASGSQDITSGLIESNDSDAGYAPSGSYSSWANAGNDMNNILVAGDTDATHSTSGVTVQKNTVRNTGRAGLWNHYNASVDWYYNTVENTMLEDANWDRSSMAVTNNTSGAGVNQTVNIFGNTFWNETAVQNHKYVILIHLTNLGTCSFMINVKNNIISGSYALDGDDAAFGLSANAGCPLTLNRGSNLYYLNRTETLVYATPNDIVKDYNLGGELANSTDPRIIASSNFALLSVSPAIDAGTDVGLTTDYAGNPIYGLPDIGAYEYQPPYDMGTDEVDIAANVRVYGDGKFRNTEAAGGTTADLSVDPVSDDKSEYLDIQISNWETSGNYSKEWTESSLTITGSVTHAIGDLNPNTVYDITVSDLEGYHITGVDGTICHNIGDDTVACLSNASGKIYFDYDGGYSTHTFDMVEGDNTAPSGYTMSVDQTVIDSGVITQNLSFAFSDAEIGSTYSYSIDDTDGNTSPVAGSGTISSATQQITSIDVSTLSDGILTLTVYLTDPSGNQGSNATDTASKNRITPPQGGGNHYIEPQETGEQEQNQEQNDNQQDQGDQNQNQNQEQNQNQGQATQNQEQEQNQGYDFSQAVLMKVPGSNDVWVWANGTKRKVRSLEIFNSYNWNASKVLPSSSAYLDSLPETNLVKTSDSPNVYIFSNGFKRLLASIEIFNSYRLDWSKIATVNTTEMNSYQNAPLIKHDENLYWKDQNGVLHIFPTMEILTKAGYNTKDAIIIDDLEFTSYGIGIAVE